MTSKYKYYLNWIIKLVIIILATYFIWHKLTDNKNLDNFIHIIHGLNSTPVIITIGLVTILMMLNWLTESYKWRMMVFKVEPISYWTAVQSVFCGLTLGIITPNRIGDYGSRMFFLRPRKRIYGLIAMGIGAYAQFVLTNVLAFLAVMAFIIKFKPVNLWVLFTIAILFITYCTLLLLLYFNMTVINRPLKKIKFLKRHYHFFSILSTYKKSFLINILGICFLRISILIVQYYLIIHLLIPAITFPQVAMMVILLITVQTVTPTIDIIDIGVRGITAVYFFSFVTHQDIAIMATTGLIWLINLIIPAIIGVFFIINLDLFKQNR